MHTHLTPQLHPLTSLALLLPAALQAASPFVPIDRFDGAPSSAEILAFDAPTKLLYSTYGSLGNAGIQVINAAAPGSLGNLGLIDMSSLAGQTAKSVSSVAADPLLMVGFGSTTSFGACPCRMASAATPPLV